MKKILLLMLVSISIILLGGCGQIPEETDDDLSFIPFDEIPVGEEDTVSSPPSLPEETPETVPEQPPVVKEPEQELKEEDKKDLPKIVVKETEPVKLNLKVTDPDGDPITYTYTNPLNEKGEWQTEAGDAGEYKVTITASDGKSTTTQDLLIVVESKNQLPVIKNVNDITVNEGQTVTLSPVVIDPENEEVSIKYSGWMTSSQYKTNYNDAGVHKVTITTSDGVNEVSKEVTIMVSNINRAPVLSELSDVSVKEGETVKIEAIAADPDDDSVILSYSSPLDDEGEWETQEDDIGEYTVTVTASDGELEDEEEILITVVSSNSPPTLELVTEITVKEGEPAVISPVVTDPEGGDVTVSYSGWMSTSIYETNYDDAGTHTVTVTVSDGVNEVSKDVTVTVEDVNRPPVFEW
ncbi:MAG: hypothetical protein QF506_00640 [Candidatus Woesearchaeota archaeon]|nr:hypothetical protein [Candidatus Woesearchaeota archaeon]